MTKEKMFLSKILDFWCGSLRFALVGVQFWDCVQKMANSFMLAIKKNSIISFLKHALQMQFILLLFIQSHQHAEIC